MARSSKPSPTRGRTPRRFLRLARHAGLGEVAGSSPSARTSRIGVAHAAAAERRGRAGGKAEAGCHLQRARGGGRVVAARRATAAAAPIVPQVPCGCAAGRSRVAMPTRPRLVAGDGRVEQRFTAGVPRVRLGQRGGHGVDAGMAAGGVVALVELQRRAGEAVQESGHRRRGAETGAGQAARPACGVAPRAWRPPPRRPVPRRSRRACRRAPARRGRAPRAARRRRRLPARCAARIAVGDIGSAWTGLLLRSPLPSPAPPARRPPRGGGLTHRRAAGTLRPTRGGTRMTPDGTEAARP